MSICWLPANVCFVTPFIFFLFNIYFSLIIPEFILVLFRHITIEAEITLFRTRAYYQFRKLKACLVFLPPAGKVILWRRQRMAATNLQPVLHRQSLTGKCRLGILLPFRGEPTERLQARTLLAKHMHRRLFPSFHPLRQFRSRCFLTGLLPMHGLPQHPRVSLLTTLHELFNVLCYFRHHKSATWKSSLCGGEFISSNLRFSCVYNDWFVLVSWYAEAQFVLVLNYPVWDVKTRCAFIGFGRQS